MAVLLGKTQNKIRGSKDFDSFSRNLPSDFPVEVSQLLRGAYFFGSNRVDPLYNFANPELPLLQRGSPRYFNGYVRVNNFGYFDTQIAPGAETTVIALARLADESKTNGFFISNYGPVASGSNGDAMKIRAADVAGYMASGTGLKTKFLNLPTNKFGLEFNSYFVNWKEIGFNFGGYDPVLENQFIDSMLEPHTPSTKTLLVGSNQNSTITSDVDVSCLFIIDGIFTTGDRLRLIQYLYQKYAAGLE